jgi:hypothetical protein
MIENCELERLCGGMLAGRMKLPPLHANNTMHGPAAVNLGRRYPVQLDNYENVHVSLLDNKTMGNEKASIASFFLVDGRQPPYAASLPLLQVHGQLACIGLHSYARHAAQRDAVSAAAA